jgi:hypothetical protein
MISWLLLIYNVPSEPSRKRASVWREVKKVGAVYLHNGVCALPERPETLAAFRQIVARIVDMEGEATVVEGARLDATRAEAVIAQSQAARAAEYAEIARDAEGFLEHVRRETEHREFTYTESEELEEDLGKLKRWSEQVRARDYFGSEEAEQLQALFRRCDEELGVFLEQASSQDAEATR